MQNNASILSLWETMSQEHANGMVKRMFPSAAPNRIFVTYTLPENMCGVAFSYSRSIKVSVDSFKNLKELNVKLVPDTTYETNNLLIIQLASNANRDVFACLCDNLASVIQNAGTEQEAVRVVLNRLEKWKALFDKAAAAGLSPSEQQGLYGELTYLSKLLTRRILSKADSLKVWVGSDRAMRDFQGKGWAVEVKTSSSNNACQITVNGKRQLDETLLDKLYLYHLSLEVSRLNGETLNGLVDGVRLLLADDLVALGSFNAKLFEAGYTDSQRDLYEDRCYKVRAEHIYNIDGHFPRIKELDLRNGINDVVYTIDVSTCDEFMSSESEHFKIIQEIGI